MLAVIINGAFTLAKYQVYDYEYYSSCKIFLIYRFFIKFNNGQSFLLRFDAKKSFSTYTRRTKAFLNFNWRKNLI